MNFQDQILKSYIDKVFDRYDTDNSGTLDEDQMTFFFNDLFKEMGMGITVNKQQTLEAIKSIDQNSDGGIDKKQLFDAFKAMMNGPQQMGGSYPPPPQYPPYNNPYQPVHHNPYGAYNPYAQQGNYNPYGQGPQNNYYQQNPYNQYPPQNPYNPYQQNQYNPYQGGMGGSMGGSKGGSGWGKRY